ncbi:MAG: hypothetical protein IJ207_12205 [Treponema sp.]|uniref:hypothetical protein n=1 Tax=Treponema sp. TaxID=166 RepID=UPI0025FF3855|nr:hypothetical protein [Treponema sp.]MBQ9282935.1 hypothetical protein [Treponema sp.]
MKKNKFFLILIFSFLFSPGFSESDLPSLLFGYLKNDLTLQKYTLTAQDKALSYDASKIENGIELNLSTGTVKIQASSDGSKYTFTPSASLALPQLHDTTLSASFPMTKKSGFETESENGTFLDNGSLKISTAIVSSKPLKRKVTLLEAERSYIEAERAVQNQALTVENDFYTNLKNLYSYVQKVLTAKNDLYDDEIDLKVLNAQGYSKTSASYRKKYLEVLSDRRSVAENLRKLERETAIFAVKCGAEYEQVFKPENFEKDKIQDLENQAFESVMAFLPMEIPGVEMEDVLSYKSDDYTKTESAVWSKYIGDMKRKTDYSLELGIYGGYTFNESSSKYDTVDGGLTFDWRGITASAGVSLPAGQNLFPLESSSAGTPSDSPVYTFSLTLNPNTWRLSSIDKKQDELNSKIDEISIKSAADDYDTAVLDKLTERGDLRWSEKSYAEEYDMYSQLEYDMDKWLEQGSVTKSDYLDAANNRDKAQMNILINAVEKIIYNNEVKMMFVKKEN